MIFNKILSMALPLGLAIGMVACSKENPADPNGGNPVPVNPTPADPTPVDPTPVNPTPVVPSAKVYGPAPTVANITTAQTWYMQWRSTYFRTYMDEAALYPVAAADWGIVFDPYLAQGLLPGRIVWDASSDSFCEIVGSTDNFRKRGCTVSEGIGYGMLLSVFAGDMEVFNALWTYNRAFRSYNGTSNLMPWRTLTYSFESFGSASNMSSATDADLDIATSLIIAYYQTGLDMYLADARLIIADLWKQEISPTYLIYSGSTPSWKRETSAYNPSYFAPVALKLFALVDQDPTHDWNAVLNTMYTFMQNIQTAGTGVFPDWVDQNGVATDPKNGSATKTYWTFNKESVRVPWRIAWDYYWTQDPRAQLILNTLNNFISEKSAGSPANLEVSGKVMYSAVPGMADVTANSLQPHWHGAWCLTGMAGNQTWLDGCTAAFNAKTMSGFSYFPHILMTMYGELLNGLFIKPAMMPF